MAFSLKHPDQPEKLDFATREAVAAWARAELTFWSGLGISGLRSADHYVRSAQNELQRLLDAATNEAVDDTALEQRFQTTGSRFYLSTGAQGQLLTALRTLGHEPRTITAALVGLLGEHDELRNQTNNNYWAYNIIVGLAHVATLEGGGDPRKLVLLLDTIEEQQEQWLAVLSDGKQRTAANQEEHDAALAKLKDSLNEAKSALTELTANYKNAIDDIRKKFEEQFALRTPITYWTEKANRHRTAATLYRRWFAGLLVGGLAILAAVGIWGLFPFMRNHPNGYWALILFSVAIAVLAWPLRMTSKQYLVHQQLFEDASERAVIANTFLALGEQVKLTDADRQILLGSLMRPASISLASDDSGLNVADIVMAKTLTKS